MTVLNNVYLLPLTTDTSPPIAAGAAAGPSSHSLHPLSFSFLLKISLVEISKLNLPRRKGVLTHPGVVLPSGSSGDGGGERGGEGVEGGDVKQRPKGSAR